MNLAIFLMFAAMGWAQPVAHRPSPPSRLPWAPPLAAIPDKLPRNTVPQPMITHLRVAGSAIRLEGTSLGSIQRRLGGLIGHSGDASDALSWLCFYGKSRDGLWGLWLYSGEIDGPMIGGFRWQRFPRDAAVDSRCKLLQSTGSTITLPIPLHLGTTESQAEAILGRPSGRYGREAIYFHEHDLRLHHEPYTADNSVFLSYRDGLLLSITVFYTVSS